MPCFATICSCSMLLSCSKHCFLMINSCLVVNFTKSVTYYLLHFCHACLSMLLSELAVAQCSSFVKHLEWIPAMYFVAMLECCSLLFLMHLDGLVLLIADQCHICFACHFKPCIRFQWSLYRFRPKSPHISSGMLGLPIYCHVHHFPSGARICIAYHISHIIHVLHHVACAFLVVDCGSVCLCSCLG